MSETHEPSSQFLDRLEWQLCSEYRRITHLRPIPGKITVSRSMAAIAIIAGVLMAGVTALKATEYFKDSWRKRIEIARIETEIKLKTTHLEFLMENVTQAEMQFSNGVINEEEYRMLEHAVSRAELELKRSLINLDEVIASGDIPRDELYAPVVDGRDYVSERMHVAASETELALQYLRNRLNRLSQMADLGLVQKTQRDPIASEIAAQEMNIEQIQQSLDLRERFVKGAIKAQEVEIEGRIAMAERNLDLAKSKVETLQAQYKRLTELASQGVISSREAAQLEFALNAAQAELKLATLEIEVLKDAR